MIVKHFKTGFLETNNYLIFDEESKEGVLIDCTGKNLELETYIKENGVKLKYILLTHAHFDHVLGVNTFRKEYGAKSLMHQADEEILENIDRFMSGFGFGPAEIQHIDEFIKDGQILTFGEESIKVLHTPGHSPGAVCYLIRDNLFAGDTIFLECVGRTDLFGGDFHQIKESIHNKIFTLDDKTKIFPGHGNFTTVGHERENNKFV